MPVDENFKESVVPTGNEDGLAYLVPNPPLVTAYAVMYGETEWPIATSLVTGLKPTSTPFGGPLPAVGAPVGSVDGLLYLVPNPLDQGYMEIYGLPAWDTTTWVPLALMLMPAPKPETVDPLEYLLPKPLDHAQACGSLFGDAMLIVKNASVDGVQLWPDEPEPVGNNPKVGLVYFVPNPEDEKGQT